jgi:uncharacterized protein YmfQ (DUF2313 family)
VIMNLQKLIPKKKFTARAYLHLLSKLIPHGPAWKFPLVPHSPVWVSLNSYQEDDFNDLLISEDWDNAFKNGFYIQIQNEKKVAVQVIDTGTYKRLSATMTGDFQIEFGIMLINDSGSIRIRARNSGASYYAELGWEQSLDSLRLSLYNGSTVTEDISCPYSQYRIIYLRLIRSSGTISAQYLFNNLWHNFSNTLINSDDFYFETYSTINDAGFLYLWAQATSGLFETNYFQESWFGKLLSVFADELSRFEDEVLKLLRETVPGLSSESLDDWETTLKLPDEGTPTSPTLEQRQVYAHMKWTQGKGDLPEGEVFSQNKAFYIQYALSLGIIITISWGSTGTVWRWTTKYHGEKQRVTHMPTGDIDGSRFRSLNSPFVWYVTVVSDPNGNRSIIEAVFNKVKPAHTQVVFLP